MWKKLPEKFREHTLAGGYAGMRECRVKPNVFIGSIKKKVLFVERIGSHSELKMMHQGECFLTTSIETNESDKIFF